MSTEVELKLSSRTTDLPELRRALIAMARGDVSIEERLISTYYDTPDRMLSDRGLTLRVREQAGRFIQTVKAEAASEAGIMSRGEWEDPLIENRPDPAGPETSRRLPENMTDLRPLFVTDVTRTTIEIEPEVGTRIEAAVDEGEVRLAESDGAEPISEIELELKTGNRTALYDLALRLLEVAPVRLEIRSKSERGYRLAAGGESAPTAVHAKPVALDAGMTIEAALRKIGSECLTQMLRNEAAVLGVQPEGVHQMRVAMRRIRSALSSLKKLLPAEDHQWVSEELGWLGSALGLVRNLDVFATELLPSTRSGLPDEPGWDELAAGLHQLRREAYERVTEQIVSTRYTTTMLRLLRRFDGGGWQGGTAPTDVDPLALPIGEIAPSVFDRRQRKLRQRSKNFSRLTPLQRHKLRIATKKLRYTIELFGSLFDEDDLQNFVRRVKRLQDDLGYANDIRVAHDFVPELFAQLDPRSPAARIWMMVLEWHDQILAGGERKLRKHLRRLNRATPFWKGLG